MHIVLFQIFLLQVPAAIRIVAIQEKEQKGPDNCLILFAGGNDLIVAPAVKEIHPEHHGKRYVTLPLFSAYSCFR